MSTQIKPKALITGITGQDGAWLAQHLLTKGYKVYGGARRSSTRNTWRLEKLGILDQIEIINFELLEGSNIDYAIRTIEPNEIYNLAAQSFVATSFEQPIYTAQADAIAVTCILEAIRRINPKIKFYQASTSEMFGKAQDVPQTEKTPFYPRNPYGVAKLYAHWMVVNYRESYGIHACSGILFNHESQMRGNEFVTRKITRSLCQIKEGKLDVLELGNLNAKRDWGHARDYVKGMYMMMQHDTPDDYILATGQTRTVRDFVNAAANYLDISIKWHGTQQNEVAINTKTGKTIVRVNPAFYRPAEVEFLLGSAEKAKKVLGWTPETSFEQLVCEMVDDDLERAQGKGDQRA